MIENSRKSRSLNYYGDRFIPRRYALKNSIQNLKNFDKKEPNEDILKTRLDNGYWRQHNFKINLNNLFNLKSYPILQLNDYCNDQEYNYFSQSPSLYHIDLKNGEIEFFRRRNDTKKNGLDWPCKPRSRPLVFSDSTHDLPGFGSFSDSNILSWSKHGIIAASFDTDLVIWNPRTDVTSVYKINSSKTLSFSPSGEYIAIGIVRHDKPVLDLLDLEDCANLLVTSELFHTNSYTFQSKDHEPTCLEWDKKGKLVICGTKCGFIYVFKIPSLRKLKIVQIDNNALVCVKLNPTCKYIATSDVQGFINVMLWPTFEMSSKMGSRRRSKAVIDWHPWTGVDLAVSEDIPASIVIVNVQTKEIIAYYQRQDYRCSIETISFNKISAELIVSYCIQNPDGCFTCDILVMASLNRIVDVLKIHDDRVRCLLWSPDNMQLATAGDDDTLIIWNFFSICEKKSLSIKKLIEKKNKSYFNLHNNSDAKQQLPCLIDFLR